VLGEVLVRRYGENGMFVMDKAGIGSLTKQIGRWYGVPGLPMELL